MSVVSLALALAAVLLVAALRAHCYARVPDGVGPGGDGTSSAERRGPVLATTCLVGSKLPQEAGWKQGRHMGSWELLEPLDYHPPCCPAISASRTCSDRTLAEAARVAVQRPTTAKSCQVPSTPFNSCAPRSASTRSDPTTRSCTVLVVRISPGPAAAITRPAM
jgi:hypothetical protein